MKKLGYTPDRFRYAISYPNGTYVHARPWQPMTWDEITAKLKDIIESASDPVFAVEIIAIDPLGGE